MSSVVPFNTPSGMIVGYIANRGVMPQDDPDDYVLFVLVEMLSIERVVGRLNAVYLRYPRDVDDFVVSTLFASLVEAVPGHFEDAKYGNLRDQMQQRHPGVSAKRACVAAYAQLFSAFARGDVPSDFISDIPDLVFSSSPEEVVPAKRRRRVVSSSPDESSSPAAAQQQDEAAATTTDHHQYQCRWLRDPPTPVTPEGVVVADNVAMMAEPPVAPEGDVVADNMAEPQQLVVKPYIAPKREKTDACCYAYLYSGAADNGDDDHVVVEEESPQEVIVHDSNPFGVSSASQSSDDDYSNPKMPAGFLVPTDDYYETGDTANVASNKGVFDDLMGDHEFYSD